MKTINEAMKAVMDYQDSESASKGPFNAWLDEFVGTWKMTGQNAPVSREAQGEAVLGDQTYEWHEGEYFLISRWSRVQGVKRVRFNGLGWIGYDEKVQKYLSHSINNLGFLRVYQIEVQPGKIIFIGTHERAVIELSPDKATLSETWEWSQDGKSWKNLCRLQGARLQ